MKIGDFHRTGLMGDRRSHLAREGRVAPICGASGPCPDAPAGICPVCIEIAKGESKLALERVVPPENFLRTVATNVDNEAMTDADFRQFIRNSLPIVKF